MQSPFQRFRRSIGVLLGLYCRVIFRLYWRYIRVMLGFCSVGLGATFRPYVAQDSSLRLHGDFGAGQTSVALPKGLRTQIIPTHTPIWDFPKIRGTI